MKRSGFASAYVDLGDNVQTPVCVVLAGAEELDVDRVVSRPLEISDSLSVRLAGLASYTVEERPSAIQRIDQRYRRFGIGLSVGGLLPEGYYTGYGSGISGIRLEAVGPNYEDLDALVNRFARFLEGRSRRVAVWT